MIHEAKPLPVNFSWKRTLCRVALCGATLLPGIAGAQESRWFGGSGAWEQSSNWTGGLPNTSSTAYLNSGTASVTVYGEYASLISGTNASGTSTIALSGNGYLTGGETSLGNVAGSRGTMLMSGNDSIWAITALTLGVAGQGILDMSGGSVTSENGITLGSLNGSVGTATISGGSLANLAETLKVGASGTGSFTVSGGYVWTGYTAVGDSATGAGQLVVNSGTYESQDEIRVGVTGTGLMTIGGGQVFTARTILGSSSGGYGEAVINSGTWNTTTSIEVGTYASRGELAINGGTVTSNDVYAGDSGGTGSIAVTGGTWTNSVSLQLGLSGTASMSISGGYVSSAALILGQVTTGKGTVLVTGGTLAISGFTLIGEDGLNSRLDIESGGVVTTGGNVTIGWRRTGPSAGNFNTASVTGEGSVWLIEGRLIVGDLGANNLLTVQDDALVRIGQTLEVSFRGGASNNNFVRLDGGYIALFGNQMSAVTSLITNGEIQIWDGETWVVSTDLADYDYDFFATDQAAADFSGYEDLGGYTILTTVVPEPQTWALLGIGAVLLVLRRRRAQAN